MAWKHAARLAAPFEGGDVVSGDFRDMVTITFGTGEIDGIYLEDKVHK